MARSRSAAAPLIIVVLAAFGILSLFNGRSSQPQAFVPAARLALSKQVLAGPADAGKVAYAAALASVATSPLPAFAEEEEEEGFDFRIIAVLGLPLIAVSWALFNVWRVAFRQGTRIGEGLSGSSKT